MLNISVTDKLSPTAANQLEKHLDSDEEAFWADQPQAVRMALPWIASITFIIILDVFIIFYISKTLPEGIPGILLLVFISGFIYAGFIPLYHYLSAKRTVYAVTDQRAIIINLNLLGSINLKSFTPGQLQNLEIAYRSNGSGDIVLEQKTCTSFIPLPNIILPCIHKYKIGFMALPDVREAEKYIKALSETTDE